VQLSSGRQLLLCLYEKLRRDGSPERNGIPRRIGPTAQL